MSLSTPRSTLDRILVFAALGCSLVALFWPRLKTPAESDQEALRREIEELRVSLHALASRPARPELAVSPAPAQTSPVTVEQLHDWFWTLDRRMLGLEERLNPANRSIPLSTRIQLDREKARKTVLDPQAAPHERVVALRMLRMANTRTSDVVQAMIALQASSTEGGIRADIFRQLSGVSDPLLRAPLLQALRNDTHPGVREEAAETLAPFAADPEVRAALSTAMQLDVNPRVRDQARMTLEGQSDSLR